MKLPKARRLLTILNTLRNTSQLSGLKHGYQTVNAAVTSSEILDNNLNLDKIRALGNNIIGADNRRIIRLALASAGVLLLVLSYELSSLVLTFMGLGLVLWAVLLLYITQSRYVHQDILMAAPLSLTKTIDNIIAGMGYGAGKPIFFYPKNLKGQEQGSLFVCLEDKLRIPTDEQMVEGVTIHQDPNGLALSAPSSALVELFERRLNTKFSIGDLPSVQENIAGLLTEELRIVDDISLERKDDHSFSLKMVGGPSVEICKMVSSQTKMGNRLGCPLCGAFALILCKISGMPVYIKHTAIDENSIETIFEQYDVSVLDRK